MCFHDCLIIILNFQEQYFDNNHFQNVMYVKCHIRLTQERRIACFMWWVSDLIPLSRTIITMATGGNPTKECVYCQCQSCGHDNHPCCSECAHPLSPHLGAQVGLLSWQPFPLIRVCTSVISTSRGTGRSVVMTTIPTVVNMGTRYPHAQI